MTDHFLSYHLRKWLDLSSRTTESFVPPRLPELCRKQGIPLLQPPNCDINHPDFIEMLQDRLRPKWALSCYCPQIFRPELLAVFEAAINYHNSLLPAYRGLRATAWSMYHGEDETGFTFHFMTEKIDAGKVLLQRSIPITKGVSYRELELNKALLAKACLNEVFSMLFAGSCGKTLQGPSTYFSRKAWYDLTTVNDPSRITASELNHRLQCFEIVKIRIRNRYYPVTRLIATSSAKSLSFSTEDGVVMTPVRFLYLPYYLFRFYQLIRKDV